MTTDDDNATTWRDLADQLTPAQIARFDHAEQLCITGAHLAFPQNDRSKKCVIGCVGAELRMTGSQRHRASLLPQCVTATRRSASNEVEMKLGLKIWSIPG
jgi:hypothetical protein